MSKLIQTENHHVIYLNPISEKLRNKKSKKTKLNLNYNQNQKHLSVNIQIKIIDPSLDHYKVQKNLHKSQKKLKPIIKQNTKIIHNKGERLTLETQQSQYKNSKSFINEIQHKAKSYIIPRDNYSMIESFHEKGKSVMAEKENFNCKKIEHNELAISNRRDLIYQLKSIKQRLHKINLQKICLDLQRFRPSTSK